MNLNVLLQIVALLPVNLEKKNQKCNDNKNEAHLAVKVEKGKSVF